MTTMILQAYYIIAYLKNSRPPKYRGHFENPNPNQGSRRICYLAAASPINTHIQIHYCVQKRRLTIYIRFPRYLIATNPISNTEYQKD